MDKCLKVNDDSVEVWCVPSATRCHVLIEVGMKFSVSRGLLFFKTPLYFHFSCGQVARTSGTNKTEMISSSGASASFFFISKNFSNYMIRPWP